MRIVKVVLLLLRVKLHHRDRLISAVRPLMCLWRLLVTRVKRLVHTISFWHGRRVTEIRRVRLCSLTLYTCFSGADLEVPATASLHAVRFLSVFLGGVDLRDGFGGRAGIGQYLIDFLWLFMWCLQKQYVVLRQLHDWLTGVILARVHNLYGHALVARLLFFVRLIDLLLIRVRLSLCRVEFVGDGLTLPQATPAKRTVKL